MYCPDKLKLNRFKHVRIPDNASYFGRAGMVKPDSSSFGSEDEVIPTMRQKLDAIAQEFDQWREYVDSHPDLDENSSE